MTGRGGLMMPMPMKHASNRIPESSIPNEVRNKALIAPHQGYDEPHNHALLSGKR